MMHRKACIGIDLGTSYSSVSFFDESRMDCIVMEMYLESLFPNYITFRRDSNGKISYLFGKPAKENRGPYSLYDSTRLIGKTWEEYQQMGSEKDGWTFNVTKDVNGCVKMVVPNPLNIDEKMEFYPEEVTAMILIELMKLMKQRIGKDQIGKVVITVPVTFSPSQRAATIRACKIAGIENVELINEPSAAVIGYKRFDETQHKGTLKEGSRILVVDFRESLKVCCCQIGKKSNIQVLATGGDQNLSGKLFDEIMRDLILEKIEKDYPDHISKFKRLGTDSARVAREKKCRLWKVSIEAEKAKQYLSKYDSVQIQLEQFLGEDGYDQNVLVSRREFEDRCKLIINKMEGYIAQVMKDAGVAANQIDLVLPIGEPCQIPMVRETIYRMFPDQRKRANPFFDSTYAFSNGASYKAFRYHTSGVDNDDTLQERLPYGVGVELSGKRMSYFAKKNDSLPITNSLKLNVTEDNQRGINLSFFSGNAPKSDDPGMTSIGQMTIPLPPNTKINDVLILNMTITKSGLMKMKITRERDGAYLGRMDINLMNQLDDRIGEMRKHVLQFE